MKAHTKEHLLELYQQAHGNFYDYSLMDLDNKINGKIKIICPEHGKFLQSHYDHIRAGCPKCASIRKKRRFSKILINGIQDLIDQFGDKFDFSTADFKNTSSPLIVWCKQHNQWFRNTAHHIARGAGCADCKKEKISSKKKLSTEEFIKRAIIKHSSKYDYSLVEYKTLTDAVKIICPEHGVFEQKPRDHIRGHGCPLCASTTVSSVSQKWLSSLNLSLVREHKIVHDLGYYVVDGFDSTSNTIYEFYGDYWHGNPKTFDPDATNPSLDKKFRDLYNDTMLREQILKDLGYNLVTIWESDFYAASVRQTNDQDGSKKTRL